jgi:hypothetical protein
MRGYLPAWSVRLLPGVVRVPSSALRQLPSPWPGQVPAERLELLERLAREERRVPRADSYGYARRLY